MNRARQFNMDNPTPSYTQPQKRKKQIVVQVKRRSWISRGEKIMYSFFGIALIVASLYIVSYAAKTDQLNREVLQLEQSVHQQKLENEALYFEVSELSSPERIIKIARENGLKIQDAKVKRATNVNK